MQVPGTVTVLLFSFTGSWSELTTHRFAFPVASGLLRKRPRPPPQVQGESG